jgi:hypothetical protein
MKKIISLSSPTSLVLLAIGALLSLQFARSSYATLSKVELANQPVLVDSTAQSLLAPVVAATDASVITPAPAANLSANISRSPAVIQNSIQPVVVTIPQKLAMKKYFWIGKCVGQSVAQVGSPTPQDQKWKQFYSITVQSCVSQWRTLSNLSSG